MISGTGLTDFDKALNATPPTAGKGIFVGENLYLQLTVNKRITLADYQLTGSSFKLTHTTLDSQYPITIDPYMGIDDYKYI